MRTARGRLPLVENASGFGILECRRLEKTKAARSDDLAATADPTPGRFIWPDILEGVRPAKCRVARVTAHTNVVWN
eukprot:5990440-Amphidinium_carterae.1